MSRLTVLARRIKWEARRLRSALTARLFLRFDELGEGFICGRHNYKSFKNEVRIGKNFSMEYYCRFHANARIGDDVMFAPFVSLVGGDHRFDTVGVAIRDSGRDEFLTVTIEDDVWVGLGAILIHGITVGEGSIIAAGSVVTKDVPPNSIAGGNPARVLRRRFEDPRDLERHQALRRSGSH